MWKIHACGKERLLFKHFSHFLRAPSQLFLKFANQLIILALCVGEIVIRQLSILLFKLALDFIPRAFELEFVHIWIVRQCASSRLYRLVGFGRESTLTLQEPYRSNTGSENRCLSRHDGSALAICSHLVTGAA